MTPNPTPTFRALRKERDHLNTIRMGCDLAAYFFPQSACVTEDQAAATAALDAWDSAHADEWNTLKPWYERRLVR